MIFYFRDYQRFNVEIIFLNHSFNFYQLQYCSDFDRDFGLLWNKIGENVRSLTFYFIPILNIFKLLNSCHNLKAVDLLQYKFEGK